MTGHEVPGGQPIITVLRLSITSFTAFITGTGIGSPMSSSPKAKSISHVFAVFTTPTPRFCSVIASRGHTIVQPPQPWQSCGKLCTSPFIPALGRTTNNALYSQNLEHSPLLFHQYYRTSGTCVHTGSTIATIITITLLIIYSCFFTYHFNCFCLTSLSALLTSCA